MTINHLWPIVKKCEKATGEIEFSAFKGEKIAIDISILENKNLYGAYNHEYRKNIVNDDVEVEEETAATRFQMINIQLAINFLSYGILPVFVFDGEKRPEKEDKHKEREKSHHNTAKAIKKYQKRIDRGEVLSRDEKESFYKLKSRKKVTKKHNEDTMNVLKYIGFPCLTATFDAEKLCTMLCIEGKVRAVYSSDGDNLAMGCPLLLTEHKTDNTRGKKTRYFKYTKLKYVLKELNMSKKKFLHMCVLLGTDFNKNIRGMGQASVLNYMEKHNRIKEGPLLDKYGDNCSDFFKQYKKTLEILGREKSSDCCQEEINLELNIDTTMLRERLDEYGLGSMTQSIIGAIKKYESLVNTE